MRSSCYPTLRLACGLLLALSVSLPATLPARSIIEAGNGTVWKYLDNGHEPDAAWRGADFNDSDWESGKAPLGYGRPGLGTEVGFGGDKDHRFITTWFRRTFDRPELKPGERLAINFCVDDGAVIYLNGRELGRANMPHGLITANTLAPNAIGANGEGFYLRMGVPVSALRPGRNVLAVEVHQCSPESHDVFFDLALKSMPAEAPTPFVPAAARKAVESFRYQNFIGPDIRIPDGYEDGGHAMKLDSEGWPTPGREILRVDRDKDAELARHIAFARSAAIHALPPLERVHQLAVLIDRETTPPGGMRWDETTCEHLEREFANQAVLLGDWIEQAHAGVCRHRALLFKVLADEAGLKAALVRGHWYQAPPKVPHVWNEVLLDDGRRVLVDVTIKRSKQDFPEVTAREVARQYRKLDGTPWYGAAASKGQKDDRKPGTKNQSRPSAESRKADATRSPESQSVPRA